MNRKTGRQTGENASFPSANTNSTHMREISGLKRWRRLQLGRRRGRTSSVQSKTLNSNAICSESPRSDRSLHFVQDVLAVWDHLNRTAFVKQHRKKWLPVSRSQAAIRTPEIFCALEEKIVSSTVGVHGPAVQRRHRGDRPSGRELRMLCCEDIASGTLPLGLTDVSWCQRVTSSCHLTAGQVGGPPEGCGVHNQVERNVADVLKRTLWLFTV